MKGDGHIRGENYFCESGVILQEKISKNDNTLHLCITLLTGEAFLFLMICARKWRNKLIELGVDPSVEDAGLETDKECMMNNKGPGKRFPGGTTCNFRGNNTILVCMKREGIHN